MMCTSIQSAIARNTNTSRTDKNQIKVSTSSIQSAIKRLKTLLPDPNSTVTTEPDTSSIRDVVREELAKFREELQRPSVPEHTFAQVVSKSSVPSRKIQVPKSRPALILESADANVKTSKDVMDVWKKKISFKDSDFAPAKVQPVSNNKVRVEFDNVQQRDATLHKLTSVKKLKAQQARKLRPLVILKGIVKDVNPDEVLSLIKSQNPSICSAAHSEDDLKKRFVRNNKKDSLFNIVLEVSPSVRVQMLSQGRINVDHQRVRVEDFSAFIQCFKCLQFGHTQAKCESTAPVCSHCASKDHSFKDCPDKKDDKKVKCANCHADGVKHQRTVNDVHSATSVKKCPIIKSMIQRINGRTDYGL